LFSRALDVCKVAADQTLLLLPAVTDPGSLTLFRYSDYDVPFWARPNSRPGRWHTVGNPPTQYWSMTPDAAWSELIRAEHLQQEEELNLVRMPLWACRFPATGLLDLRTPEAQDQLAITAAELTSDDWSACQALGQELRRNHPGVITPCAALDRHANLTIFGARRHIDWRQRPALASAVPAAVVAIGRPPDGLIHRVRRRIADSGWPRLF
jgi:RES domain-containing protein